MIVNFQPGTTSAATVNCSPGSVHYHCYALLTWNHNISGAHTQPDTFGNMVCGSGCTGDVSDEIWLSDSSGLRDVEAGIRVLGGAVYIFYSYSTGDKEDHNFDIYKLGSSGMSLDPYFIDVYIYNTYHEEKRFCADITCTKSLLFPFIPQVRFLVK